MNPNPNKDQEIVYASESHVLRYHIVLMYVRSDNNWDLYDFLQQ